LNKKSAQKQKANSNNRFSQAVVPSKKYRQKQTPKILKTQIQRLHPAKKAGCFYKHQQFLYLQASDIIVPNYGSGYKKRS
jgi:hypothetical protein